MSKKLLKSGLIVSVMTLISRVLGLIRDVVIAQFMGAGTGADVFFFANKIPNFLRRLFAEGAFAQAFIPVLTEVHEKQGEDAMRDFIAKAAGTLGIVVTLVALVGVIASPIVVALFGMGWFLDYWQVSHQPGAVLSENAAKFELASAMLKITFPYLAFITLTGLAGAILNTLNRFAVSSFTPVLLNVSIIVCAIVLREQFSQPAFALAWGVFLGGLVQLLFQLPFLAAVGVLVWPKWSWNDPNVTKVRRLMIPALFGVSVAQVNLLLDTLIASFLETGSISWLYYSDRLLEFPLGLFGIAIATVILPSLSQHHVKDDKAGFTSNLNWAITMVCLLGVPAAVGLMVLAEPLLLVIFQRGEFTLLHAQNASFSLMAYSAGLIWFMLIKVLAPGFFSRQDTKTPVKIGIWCMTANMGFNLILAVPFGYVGLAAATSLSAMLNAGLLFYKLSQDQVLTLSLQTKRSVMQIVAASVVMICVLIGFNPSIENWYHASLGTRASWLALLILGSGVVYLLSLWVFGLRPRQLLKAGG